MGSPPDPGVQRGLARRSVLVAGLAAGAAGAGFGLTELVTRGRAQASTPDPPVPVARPVVAGREYELNTGWLFGRYATGADQVAYDEDRLTPVTLPHCVTELSWQRWDPRSWEDVWVYQRHLDGDQLRAGQGRGGRVLVGQQPS